MQATWSDALGQLTLPALPGVGGASALGMSPLPGIAPLVAGTPQIGAGARMNARPVVTASRTMSDQGGDPVGLTLFACVAAAVAAGLSRRRSRSY
jgi:uncharacterized membrane protein